MVDNNVSKSRKEEILNKTLHALSDPTRRQIVELLRQAGTLRVGDLAEVFAMSLNGVSKHLKVLEQAGVVNREIKGREHFISVNWKSLQIPYEWLHFYHHFWSTKLDALVDYLKGKETKK